MDASTSSANGLVVALAETLALATFDTVCGNGGSDCFLGGGGSDSLRGDGCIGGPGTDTFHSSCETQIQLTMTQ